jgi:lipopolysaccharide export system permease protein
MALSAILGGGFSRLGYGRRIAALSAIAAVVRLLGFQVTAASEDEAWLNILQYAVPLLATWGALASIFRQKVSRYIDITTPRPGAGEPRRPAEVAA